MCFYAEPQQWLNFGGIWLRPMTSGDWIWKSNPLVNVAMWPLEMAEKALTLKIYVVNISVTKTDRTMVTIKYK